MDAASTSVPSLLPAPRVCWRGSTLWISRDERRCIALDFADPDRVMVTVFNPKGSEVFDIEAPSAARLGESIADCLGE